MLKQKLEQLTAHDKILIFDNFRYLLEALEEYIEKSGYYPNFISKRQFKYLTISKGQSRNLTLASAEDMFSTRLLIFVGMNTPNFLIEDVKEEFYKWINLVEIDVNNCPDKKLKHFLLEIENVIEGKSEKILEQTEEYLSEKKKTNPINPNEMLEIFGAIQGPLNKNRTEAENLKSKTHVEVENKNKLKGNWKEGKKSFNQLTSEVSGHRDSFNFYQKSNLRQQTSLEIIQDVKNNPNNWRIEEVITGYDVFNRPKKEEALIYHSVQLDLDGGIIGSIERQPVYPVSKFNQAEIAEINRAKNISQTPINQQLVNNINQNTRLERNIVVFDPKSGKYSEADDWFVYNEWNNTNEVGCLIFNSDAMVRAKDLSEGEQKAVNYSKSEAQSQLVSTIPKGDEKSIGSGGVFAIIGVVSALLVASVVIARKRLNNKSKE